MIYLFNGAGSHYIDLIPGKYLLECWGAQGGTSSADGERGGEGGKGAYVSGEFKIDSKRTFFIFVGGKGCDGSPIGFTTAKGGFNGGGNGGMDTGPSSDDGAAGGGGATDVRLIDGTFDNSESLKAV